MIKKHDIKINKLSEKGNPSFTKSGSVSDCTVLTNLG